MIATTLIGLAACLGCASNDASRDDAAGEPAVLDVAGSPWDGLSAAEAVNRFLEQAIPYSSSNNHLIDSLADSYGGSLSLAIAEQLDEILAEVDDSDLRRFLLVRVGCRWAYRHRDDGYGVAMTESLRNDRRALLLHLGNAVDEIDNATYQRWLRNVDEDRACLEAIETLRRNDGSNS